MNSAIETQGDLGRTGLVQAGDKPPRLVVSDNGEASSLMDTARFEHVWRIAKMFSSSDMVPQHFRNKPENCCIAVQLAFRLGVDPFMLLQKCYIVHGRPGIEAQLAIALANARGPFKGRIRYRMSGSGESRSCTACATLAENGDVVEFTVDWQMATRNGWVSKDGSLWPKLPDLMLQYRSATYLVRTVCPDVLLGLHTDDELRDMDYPDDKVSSDVIVKQLDAVLSQEPTASHTERIESVVDVHAEPTDFPTDPRPDAQRQREEYLSAIDGFDGIRECTDLIQTASKDPLLTAEDKELVIAAANKQAAAIRRRRGQRTNGGGKMFDTSESATEAGM